ncbi:MAG: calcium/sodium antiporter [Hyphomicrobiaceae bacterium]
MDPILAIALGFIMLILGGEALVRGAVRIAEIFNVSPLIIGIVLVGFGTSAPEMAISLQAATLGSPGIAVGNFVGSSISNILFILGLSALVMPIDVTSRALSRDGMVVVLAAVAFAAVSLFLPLDTYVGFVFLLWLASYLVYAWRQERREKDQGSTSAMQKAEAHGQLRNMTIGTRVVARVKAGRPIILALTLAIAGLILLVIGGRILVEGAVQLARQFNIDQAIIGLTIVAVGTSMPELVTSLVAAFRRQPAVAVGNILGSNIYNILGVGGMIGIISPTAVPDQIIYFDNIVLVAASVLLLIFARSGFRLSRIEGLILFAGYGLYLYVLAASVT